MVYCLVAAGIIGLAGVLAIVSSGAAQDGSPTAGTTGTATTGTPGTTGTPSTGGTGTPAAATSTRPAGSPTGGAAGTSTSAPVGGPDTGTGTADSGGSGLVWLIALLPVVAFGAFFAASRVRSE
jgi:hypothetical protein